MSELRMIVRDVPWPSKMVALVDADGVTHTSFVVHEDETRTLRIFLFRGDPRQPWREWAAEHFPQARRVAIDRMRGDGLHERPPIRLRPGC